MALSEESRWIETQTRERCEKETSEKMKEVRFTNQLIDLLLHNTSLFQVYLAGVCCMCTLAPYCRLFGDKWGQ